MSAWEVTQYLRWLLVGACLCVAPPLDLATQVENLVGEGAAKDKLLYRGADETVDEIVGWLEEGNL